MPMCTYLSETQHTRPTSDADLNSLLAEVRSATGEDWRIGEVQGAFTLYAHVSHGEFQVLNLRGSSVGTVEAFLFGIMAGRQALLTRAESAEAELKSIR